VSSSSISQGHCRAVPSGLLSTPDLVQQTGMKSCEVTEIMFDVNLCRTSDTLNEVNSQHSGSICTITPTDHTRNMFLQ
jgi:hypothetical protein